MTKLKAGAKPVFCLTMGDPYGIGPEVVIKALAAGNYDRYRVLVVGAKRALQAYGAQRICEVSSIADVGDQPGTLYLLCEPAPFDYRPDRAGTVDLVAGDAVVGWIRQAASLVRSGRSAALVTAPINKESMRLAGHLYAGHTELLAELNENTPVAMMLAGGALRVVLVSTHLPLQEAIKHLSVPAIVEKVLIADSFFRRFYGRPAKLALCALNPHGGENGQFGDEEARLLEPAVELCRQKGVALAGPYPADTLFVQAQDGRYDAVVCLYHDQGLIPLKLLSFGQGVNITLGLPMIRTSVDHGTAFDIVGQNKAAHGSLQVALDWAWDIHNGARCVAPQQRGGDAA